MTRVESLTEFPIRPVLEARDNIARANTVDFSGLSDTFASAALLPAAVKDKSKTLPTTYQISRHDAFHVGAKSGTGAAAFYNLINRIKAVFGLVPKERYGKLADIAKVARNDARALYGHIQALEVQFAHVLSDESLNKEDQREAAFLALYFLDTCHSHLAEALEKLKTYEGLAKANPRVGYAGVLVAGKTTYDKTPDPIFVRKEGHKAAEAGVLNRVAQERATFEAALSRLNEMALTCDDYADWKKTNAVDIEVSLNRYRGAGAITGITIQGLITASINFGVASATLNPIVFAAGAYYAVSTVMKCVETALGTGVETRYIQAQHAGSSQTRQMSHTRALDVVNIIHEQADSFANTAFGVAGTVFTMPVTMGRPAGMSEINVGSAHELVRLERTLQS